VLKPVQKLPRDILALDLGTSLGWSFAREGVIGASGIVKLDDAGDLPGRRFVRFYNWINKFSGVDMILYESIGAVGRMKNAAAVKTMVGQLALLEMFCAGGRIPLRDKHLMTLKKDITGYGKSDKEQMCRVMHSLGWDGGHPGTMIDDDESDACCIIMAILNDMGYSASFKGSDTHFREYLEQNSLIN